MNGNAGEVQQEIEFLDRISNVSDDWKAEILNFCSAEQCVRSAVLSHTWRFIWRQVECWKFSDRYYREKFGPSRGCYKFRVLVDNVLWLHEGRIRQFSLNCHSYEPNNLNRWMCALRRKHLEYLLLESTRCIPYALTEDFFRCCHLKWVHLNHCTVDPPQHFDFPHLKSLNLTFCSISGSDLEALVCNSPVLESMIIRNCFDSGDNCVHLKSDKLQTLYISSGFFHVHLSAPSLCELKLNLRDQRGDINAFVEGNCKFSIAKSLGSLPQVHILWIAQSYLLAPLSRAFLHTFSSIRELGLYVDFGDMHETRNVIDLIRNCQALETLVLLNSKKQKCILPGLSNLDEMTHDLDFCTLRRLHVVNFNTEPMLRFVQKVIAVAPILEDFTFYNLFDNSIIEEFYKTTTWAKKHVNIRYNHYVQ